MKGILFVFNIPCIILLFITGFMIYTDKPNWGWVLFAALLVLVGPSSSSKEDKK